MESGLPKLAWVAVPLLLALAVLGWRWWRGHPPTRLALNVWASLLLLVYLAATAGLGIFWVAQQQLPVFDWHYLFGYATLLLLGLHLWLNFGVVWRYLVRRRGLRGAAPPLAGVGRPVVRPVGAAAPDGSPRRRLLAWGAGLAAMAGAGWLGWRQGYEAGRLQALASLAGGGGGGGPGGGEAGSRAAAQALVEQFHALSSSVRRGGLPGAPPVSWGDPPPPFKRLGTAGALPLPAPLRAADRGAAAPVALATALWHTAAVTQDRGGLALRASPSSGALFATELYLVVRDGMGVPPGVWHYDVPSHALVPVPAGGGGLASAAAGAALGPAPAAVVATGLFRRTGYKYRDRAYRYMLADLGHALENLRLAAAAAGLPLQLLQAFDDGALGALLGLDAEEEGVLMLARVGPMASVARGESAPSASVPVADTTGPVGLAAAAGPRALGLTHLIHEASGWRGSGPADPPGRAPQAWPGDPLPLIAQRRSRRRTSPQPLAAAVLPDMLAALQADRPLLSPAVRAHVVVLAADGLATGVWHWEPATRVLRPGRTTDGLRAASRAAALDQDVVGDAAAVLVLALDRAVAMADPGGPARGYRHGLLEAGLIGERWYLQAEALGLAACGVGAFFDDEIAALVGRDASREWVVHLATLGRRAG